MMCLYCYLASQDHAGEGSCGFMSGSSSLYVTIRTSSVAIDIAVVEI